MVESTKTSDNSSKSTLEYQKPGVAGATWMVGPADLSASCVGKAEDSIDLKFEFMMEWELTQGVM